MTARLKLSCTIAIDAATHADLLTRAYAATPIGENVRDTMAAMVRAALLDQEDRRIHEAIEAVIYADRGPTR